MATTVSQPGYYNLQALTSLGALGAGMRLYTYTAGTTTKKNAYTEQTGTTVQTYTSDGGGGEYIALDARGELPAPLYLMTGAYDLVLKTAAGATVWTRRAEPIPVSGVLNVIDFGATGDGSTNDATAIAAAVAAAAGKTLYFPKPTSSYKISSNINKPSGAISVIIDPGVTFTGTGRMFAIDGNTYHDYTGTTFSQSRSDVGVAGRGYAGLSSEFIATAGFLGNGCGAFFSAKTPDNAVGFYWGVNPILELNPGLTGNGIACEIDLNNYTAHGKGQGVLVTGVGNYSSQVGVAIERADLTSDWQFGSIIKNAQVGMRIDGTAVVAPTGGLEVIGYANNLAKFVPLNDTTPGDAIMYIANAAETVVNWKVTKRGGMQIGIGGAEIQKYLSASGGLTFGSIAANTTSELTVAVTGAAAGDLCLASPDIALVTGFAWSAYCASANTVTIRVANCTTGALDPDSGGTSTWRVSVLKH